ncbi:MAG TPA: Trk system potassium transporter TrkA [Desulfohalobiaceae bacterium]|nr:Trk system potassium transporter TrkA [Desulfohalobiaceae bacterium]
MRIIIVGAGEVGFHLAKRLVSENKEVVIIDKNQEVLSLMSDQLDVETVLGSGSSPKVLEEAGVKEADILLAVTDSDEINLIACTFTNILAPNLIKVARIRNSEYTEYQDTLTKDLLHIDIAINPEQEVIGSIERLMGAPGAAEISEFSDVNIKLVGVWIREESKLSGMNLAELKKRMAIEGFIVAAIIRGKQTIIPMGADSIHSGDLVYFVCHQKDLEDVLRAFGKGARKQHNVLIIGGGNIGYKLALDLEEKKGVNVKILDKDVKRCEFLAEHLNKTIVLQGDGTDQKLLVQENIGDMDAVVSVTGDEENNVLCSLLVKNLGAKLPITRINKYAYIPLMHTIGLEHIVSPRLSAANSILRYVRQGTVISSISIKEEAEALEVIAKSDSPLVNKPIRSLQFPKGAIVLCLIRGDEVILPTGENVIYPNDRVIILTASHKVDKLEKALTSGQEPR